MSSWVFPTTADVGIRTFSQSLHGLIEETTAGIQQYQILKSGNPENNPPRSMGTWAVPTGGDMERGLVRWLEEVLYRGYGEGQWLVDSSISISEEYVTGHVTWVDSDLVEREIEVKAITMHELILMEVEDGQVVLGEHHGVPDFEGPGWMSQVILDI